MRNLANAFLEPRLAPLPAFAAEPIERDQFAVAAIAAEDIDILDRDVKLVAPGIGQHHAIVRGLADRDRLQPFIAADAVVHVDHQVARSQRGQFSHEGVGALLAFLAADQPVTQQILLGNQFQPGVGKAVIKRQDQSDGRTLRRQTKGLLPGFGLDRSGFDRFAQDRGDPGAAAGGVAGDDRLAALRRLTIEVPRSGLVNVVAPGAFGRKIAAGAKTEVDDSSGVGLTEDISAVNRLASLLRRQLFLGEIERIGLERSIGIRRLARGIGARGEVIGNVTQPLIRCALGGAVDHDQVIVTQMIKQRDHAVFEQRQPMLHTRQPAPVADCLIERIAGGIGSEQLAIARAEALDALVIEQGFAGWQQEVLLARADRALGIGIEQPHRFQLVAKEIEPQPDFEPRGEDIEDRPAHGVFTSVDHGIGAAVALPLEQADQAFAADLHPRLEQPDRFADAKRGKCALQHRVDRGDQQLRPLALALQAVKRSQAACANRQRGTGAVIRQAVPAGKGDDIELWRKEGGGIGYGLHGRFVWCDKHGATLGRTRQVGQHQWLGPACQSGEGQRCIRREDLVQVSHDARNNNCPAGHFRASGVGIGKAALARAQCRVSAGFRRSPTCGRHPSMRRGIPRARQAYQAPNP